MIPPRVIALADQAQAQTEDFLDELLNGLDGEVPEFLPYLAYLNDQMGAKGFSRENRFLLPVIVAAVRRLAAQEGK